MLRMTMTTLFLLVTPSLLLADSLGVWEVRRDNLGYFHLEITRKRVPGTTIPRVVFATVQHGGRQQIPVVGDWNGDGRDDLGVWEVRRDNLGYFHLEIARKRVPGTEIPRVAFTTVQHGVKGQLPVVGDWDGDGKDDLGVWEVRADNLGYFHLEIARKRVPGADVPQVVFKTVQHGGRRQIPVVGDWNGDGKDDLGVWEVRRNTLGYFHLEIARRRLPRTGISRVVFDTVQHGSRGQVPVIGDWNRDGKDDLGVWEVRANNLGYFHLETSRRRVPGTTIPSVVFTTVQHGGKGQVPVAGKWSR